MKNKVLFGILAGLLILSVFLVAGSTTTSPATKPANPLEAILASIQQIQDQLAAQSARIDGIQAEQAAQSARIDAISSSVDGGGGNVTPTSHKAWIEIDEIPGGSTVPGHEGWIEILDFSQIGLTMRGHGEVSILKEVDKASPLLYGGASQGQYISQAVLEKDLGNGNLLRYRFHDVILKEVDVSSPKLMKVIDKSTPNIWAVPTEEVSFNHLEEVSFSYSKVEWEYVSPGETISAGWDLVQNKAI